ncbi:hypothetical protein [Paenibacillus tepidiphilus]|uniref:hypothetical protein n=1 Tax=Paenibacillus tepidiphilus TaxID=2608683 RepID=UPI0012396568|nr:hypothetical protein [Paenibacillus tepidiphilus]
MEITIKETNHVVELNLIDRNGINWIQDFVGNSDGFRPGGIERNASGQYFATAEEYAWWNKVVSDRQKLDERVADLKEGYGSEVVDAVLHAAGSFDLEDEAAAFHSALDDFEGK